MVKTEEWRLLEPELMKEVFFGEEEVKTEWCVAILNVIASKFAPDLEGIS